MRQGQNRRPRGRNNNNRKPQNALNRSFESNGPDVKVRGTPQVIAEKYVQLARDAQSSGDPVLYESYLQHAEHYYRVMMAAQEAAGPQFGQYAISQRPFGEEDDGDDEGDDDNQPFNGGNQQDHRGQQGGDDQPYENRSQQDNRGQDNRGQDNRGQDSRGPDRNVGQQRFDRNDRGGQDRGGQDRGGQDRGGQDRNNQERNGSSPRRFDRGQPRVDRNDGQNGERPRFDRGDRPERQDRPDRFAPRPDQPSAQASGSDEPRVANVDNQDQPPRRFERRPRRDEGIEPAAETGAALPAFLTNPVRVPISVPVAPEAIAPVPASSASDAGEPVKARAPRRRRSPREVMDALGAETGDANE